MDDLCKALALITGGFFSVTLIALGVQIWKIPNHVWEKARQELLERRKIARDIVQFFENK